tara:strand:- start:6282 stop:7280 length:999 start_codon:yes stop_codon:yes gene_type:complete
MINKVLILGISSFAGASLGNHLLKNSNYQIFGTYNNKRKLPFELFLKKNKNFKKLKLIKLDLKKNTNRLNKIIAIIKPNYIIDFASICMVNESWIFPEYYFKVNLFSKINFIKNLDKIKSLKKYIYISTPEIFGSNKKLIKENSMSFNPSTPYASSKLAVELFLNNFIKNSNFKIIIARFSNFYGRGQPMHRLIPKLVYCINNKKKFSLHGSGKTKRDFIFDEDFNSGIFKIIKIGKIGKRYHFSGNKYISIRNLIKKVIKIKKYSWSKLISQSKERIGKDKYYFLDCKKTRSALNWKCKTSLDSGIIKTITFYDDIFKKFNQSDVIFKLND